MSDAPEPMTLRCCSDADADVGLEDAADGRREDEDDGMEDDDERIVVVR